MGDSGDRAVQSNSVSEIPIIDENQKPQWLSATVVQHACHPQHLGRIDEPDGYGTVCGWCGEVMEMFLRMQDKQIAQATFWADGCISTMACGDMLVTLAEGKTLAEAARITPQDVVAALGGLPHSSVHCSELAVSALRKALEQAGCKGQRETPAGYT